MNTKTVLMIVQMILLCMLVVIGDRLLKQHVKLKKMRSEWENYRLEESHYLKFHNTVDSIFVVDRSGDTVAVEVYFHPHGKGGGPADSVYYREWPGQKEAQ